MTNDRRAVSLGTECGRYPAMWLAEYEDDRMPRLLQLVNEGPLRAMRYVMLQADWKLRELERAVEGDQRGPVPSWLVAKRWMRKAKK